jgi:hypothetical protein
MNQIPLLPSGEFVVPVAFDESLFQNTVQAGTPVCWFTANLQFESADSNDPDRLPLGIRGNNNNVIQSGKYQALVATPFVSGTRYYAGADANAGTLITAENDWFVGIGIDDVTLLVNANGVPIPAKWQVEHHSDSGYHKFAFGGFSERDDIENPAAGMIFIHSDDSPPRIDFHNGVTWSSASSTSVSIPSGSKMLFVQDSVPTGWTLDTAVSDRVIRVIDTASEGGDVGGAWAITGIVADPHKLSIDEMPNHDHALRGSGGGDENQDYSARGPTSGNAVAPAGGKHTIDTGGDLAHTHTVSNDVSWRPSYINALICIKD